MLVLSYQAHYQHISQLFFFQDVPYYCPSCDVSVRKAKKAKKQAQARETKAKAAVVVSDARVESHNNSDEASDSGDDQLVIDTDRSRGKTVKRKLQEKTSSSSAVVTQVIPQLEVSQLNHEVIRNNKTEEEAWLDAVESGDLDQVILRIQGV